MSDPVVSAMFEVGAQYGYVRSRRHPSVVPYIFGLKNRVEIFDLEKTKDCLVTAKEFVRKLGTEGRTILFVGSKPEARASIEAAALRLKLPYVTTRWVGGTLTNFGQIRSRVDKLLTLRRDKETGALAKYTKKEQLLIDREIKRLESLFSGLIPLAAVPAALCVVDPRHEDTAVTEAGQVNVPVVTLASSDCDVSKFTYPIPANDASRKSIAFFIEEIAKAYEEGKSKRAVSV